MTVIETSPLPDDQLPLDAFRAHLQLGTGFGTESLQEPVLLGFLRASLAAVEARIGKVLLLRHFDLRVLRWVGESAHPLDLQPVQHIEAFELEQPDGSRSAVAPERYGLQADGLRSLLVSRQVALPQIPMHGAAVLRLRAGLAQDWDSLASDLQQAVLMLAAHFYEYRSDTALDARCMPFGVSSLLERHRQPKFGMSPYAAAHQGARG